MVLFSDNEQNTVTLPNSTHTQKHSFLVKTKKKSKSQKQIPKNKVSLELFYHMLLHRSSRSLLSVNNKNVWKDTEIRVYFNPFPTSCQIYKIDKNPR